MNYGGVIARLLVPDRDGKLRDVMLSYDDSAEYADNRHCFAALVGRYANHRVRGVCTHLSGARFVPRVWAEKGSLTAVLNLYCKMDFRGTPNGCPWNLRRSAGVRAGADSAEILAQILRAFVSQGGSCLPIDVVDAKMLLAVPKGPDHFPTW